MKLSDFVDCNLEIERDCDFDSLIKTSDVFNARAITFIENEDYINEALNNKSIVGIITKKKYSKQVNNVKRLGLAYSETPKASFIKINNMIRCCYETTKIGNGCKIVPSAEISSIGVIIGDNVVIEEKACIYPGTIIGSNCIIGRQSVIGSDCYERCVDEKGNHIIAKHKGGVIIGNNVLVDQDAVIDKALFDWDYTEIHDKCYIGQGAYIAHGCKLLDGVCVYPRAFLCGNVVVDRKSKIGIGAIVANRIHIGYATDIKLGSVVTKDVEDNSSVSGNFAIPHHTLIEIVKNLSNKR